MPAETTADRRTRFVAQLLDRDLLWEETADPETFQVRLDSFVVEVAEKVDPTDGETYYTVTLYNSAGKRLEELYRYMLNAGLLNELTGKTSDQALSSLYEAARRRALNVDKSLEDAMKELDEHIPF